MSIATKLYLMIALQIQLTISYEVWTSSEYPDLLRDVLGIGDQARVTVEGDPIALNLAKFSRLTVIDTSTVDFFNDTRLTMSDNSVIEVEGDGHLSLGDNAETTLGEKAFLSCTHCSMRLGQRGRDKTILNMHTESSFMTDGVTEFTGGSNVEMKDGSKFHFVSRQKPMLLRNTKIVLGDYSNVKINGMALLINSSVNLAPRSMVSMQMKLMSVYSVNSKIHVAGNAKIMTNQAWEVALIDSQVTVSKESILIMGEGSSMSLITSNLIMRENNIKLEMKSNSEIHLENVECLIIKNNVVDENVVLNYNATTFNEEWIKCVAKLI